MWSNLSLRLGHGSRTTNLLTLIRCAFNFTFCKSTSTATAKVGRQTAGFNVNVLHTIICFFHKSLCRQHDHVYSLVKINFRANLSLSPFLSHGLILYFETSVCCRFSLDGIRLKWGIFASSVDDLVARSLRVRHELVKSWRDLQQSIKIKGLSVFDVMHTLEDSVCSDKL